MGTKMAASYASIVIHMLESSIFFGINPHPSHMVAFYRHFLFCPHGEDKLSFFIEFINSAKPTIKFTANVHRMRLLC